MKKKLLFLFLVLILVLTLSAPSVALAAKPTNLSTSGVVLGISQGTVEPAGNSGRWRVIERDINGIFAVGDLAGSPFNLSYKANIDSVETQSGNLHGVLTVGSIQMNVVGKIQPLTFVDFYAPGIPVFNLVITGTWTCIDGAVGNGVFIADIDFIPTPDGHVAAVLPLPPYHATVSLTGKIK